MLAARKAPMPFLPAATARALLAGFRAVGLDAEALREAAGLTPSALEPVDAILPLEAFGRLWEGAWRRAGREELPAEVGLAVPFGAFGALDYLAASSPTVEAAFHALAAHFRYVAAGFALEVARRPEGGTVQLVPVPSSAGRDRMGEVSDEFTLAVLVGRFRSRPLVPPFRAAQVRLTRPAPERATRHAALFGAPVLFGCAVAALEVPAEAWGARLQSADPVLQETLRQLAERIGLGEAGSDLELAVRARLRTLLPDGRGEAAAVARSLGLSGRTLHRRLSATGRTFREVVEAFREAEAERLLASGGVPLGEVALRLGFADQTAWNRAFRRWKGTSPRRWMASRDGAAGAPRAAGPRRSTGRPRRRRP
jgi:AraC-like DNA-binding protein